MKTLAAVAVTLLSLSIAAADSLTCRLDGVAGRTQQTVFAFSGDWEVWGFDIAGTPTWRLGKKVAEIEGCPVKLLGKYRDGGYGIQTEVGIAKKAGDININGCIGVTLPVLGQDACLYSPGMSASWQVSKTVRAGVATTFSWPSGGDFAWNAGPEVSVKISDQISVGYRNTFLGNGAQDDQLKCTFSW